MARRRRRRVDPLRAYDEAELQRQGNLLLQAALARPKQQIRREQAEARRQAEEDARMIQGFTQALATVVGRAGPAVEGVYGRATDRQRQIAQGFSGQQQQLDQAAADRANAILARNTGATQSVAPGTGSQVTYALGGMVPGNLLNETGAAMASIAHGYGAGAAGRGQQQLAARLNKGQLEQQKLREMMDDLMARSPGLFAEIMDRLNQREISKAATGIQRDYLGNAQAQTSLEYQQTIDPTTGLPYDYLADAAGAAAGAKKDQTKAVIAARKARMDALTDAKANVLSFADAQYARTKNVPGVGEQPNRPQWAQVYAQAWTRYGQQLMKFAPKGHKKWWRGQIEAMIVNALKGAGFTKSRGTGRG